MKNDMKDDMISGMIMMVTLPKPLLGAAVGWFQLFVYLPQKAKAYIASKHFIDPD